MVFYGLILEAVLNMNREQQDIILVIIKYLSISSRLVRKHMVLRCMLFKWSNAPWHCWDDDNKMELDFPSVA